MVTPSAYDSPPSNASVLMVLASSSRRARRGFRKALCATPLPRCQSWQKMEPFSANADGRTWHGIRQGIGSARCHFLLRYAKLRAADRMPRPSSKPLLIKRLRNDKLGQSDLAGFAFGAEGYRFESSRGYFACCFASRCYTTSSAPISGPRRTLRPC
jgi:hypothetical protein